MAIVSTPPRVSSSTPSSPDSVLDDAATTCSSCSSSASSSVVSTYEPQQQQQHGQGHLQGGYQQTRDGASEDVCSASTTTSCCNTKIQFGTVEVRAYGIVLGDNPSCARGPPLQLGWEYDVELTTSLDEYEEGFRTDIQRRTKIEMLLPSIIRESMLKSSGCSRSEIQHALKEIAKIQASRQKHATQTSRQMKRAELVESMTKRKFTLSPRGKKMKSTCISTTATKKSAASSCSSWYTSTAGPTSSTSLKGIIKTRRYCVGTASSNDATPPIVDKKHLKLPYDFSKRKSNNAIDDGTESTLEGSSSLSMINFMDTSTSSSSNGTTTTTTSSLIDDTISLVETNRRNRMLSRRIVVTTTAM